MVELVFARAEVFKKAIEAISVLIDEAEFKLDEKGLSLKATDPSQISMVDFKMDKSSFKTFSIDAPTRLGLDLNYLNQIMGRAKAGDEMHLLLEEENGRLLLTFKGEKGESSRHFTIPLIDISSAELPNPKIDFDAEVTIRAGALQDGLKDASLISTHVSLAAANQSFVLDANSSKGSLHNVTKKDQVNVVDIKIKNECKSMFPLDYLSDILKAANSETEVTLKLKSNSPIEAHYMIGDAHMSYFLAPRIE